ncbi:MAG: hypothetical protein BMS9Abin17_0633 [Acidimicrobiia bacterium]|nr:MAG: hypothetical protein BMS9Abin17_0633 [Acidimicrobiia bacterium]
MRYADASGRETPRGSTLRKNPVPNDLLFSIHWNTPVSSIEFVTTVYLPVDWNVKRKMFFAVRP